MTGHRVRFELVVGFAAILLPVACFAELPPLTPEEQESRSTVIVTGKVRALKHRSVVRRDGEPGFVDDQVTVSFRVEKVLKGEKVRPGQVIQVRYWQAKRRPQGWVGAFGQYEPLKVGTRARLFLKKGEHALDLLNPNGWVGLGKGPTGIPPP